MRQPTQPTKRDLIVSGILLVAMVTFFYFTGL